MSTDNIEKLYKHFGVLADAKDKVSEHEEDYLEILKAVKGSDKEKRLASQFIARFFKHFPALSDQAIEAQLDLCEDEDLAIRKQAIKDLPRLSQDLKVYTYRIADILAQLLQAQDPSELSVVHNSLMTLFKQDPKGTLTGIFSQISNGDDLSREQCMKFLTVKIRAQGSEILDKESEDFLIAECKKVLQDVTAEEFHLLMELLNATRLGKTVSGQKELVDIAAEQAELGQSFNPTDPDNESFDRLVNCVKHALPYFSKQLESTRFVVYFCDEVLPQLHLVGGAEEGTGTDQQLELLNLLADLSTFCGPLEKAESRVNEVFTRLLEFMPLPPDGDADEKSEPRLDFSHVECLIYSYHRLGRQCPEALSKDAEKLKDFRLRLHYFARSVQGYMKKLQEALRGKTGEELKSEENKLKVVALKTTSNINTLIKDLFHTPPSFKSNIVLSWKPPSASYTNDREILNDSVRSGSKRHTPITFGADSPKHPRTSISNQREIYTPPSGKYSNKVSSYMPQRGGVRGTRSRGRGFGGRGRGAWRGRNY
ncbi:apoptosis inhibitor 5 isoform X2 [Thrips palmi]|uniref:Apoptosis inhibitor 5 isoform X2 n=1 Tax=Thrips palmi TaxID=161013 RepID=A0A6P8ZZT0_THRPL|nr:apoptosis inhibitor 5 isoform X2 [Thrips palmi]